MMQGQPRGAAVVMLKEHGEERLRKAIAQGLVREELLGDFQEVLGTCESLRAQNNDLVGQINSLNFRLSEANRTLDHFKQVYNEALRAKQREDDKKARFDGLKFFALLIGGAFAVVCPCMLICRLVFGW